MDHKVLMKPPAVLEWGCRLKMWFVSHADYLFSFITASLAWCHLFQVPTSRVPLAVQMWSTSGVTPPSWVCAQSRERAPCSVKNLLERILVQDKIHVLNSLTLLLVIFMFLLMCWRAFWHHGRSTLFNLLALCSLSLSSYDAALTLSA